VFEARKEVPNVIPRSWEDDTGSSSKVSSLVATDGDLVGEMGEYQLLEEL